MRITDIVERKLEPGDVVEFEGTSIDELKKRVAFEYNRLEDMHSATSVTPQEYAAQEDKVNRLEKKLAAAISANADYDYYDKFFAAIKKNCSEILEAYKETNKVLFRGFSDEIKPFLYGRSRDYRRPLDTPARYHTLINDLMRELGIKARRDNSIFAISSAVHAKAYGKTYMIFPVDGFDFTWSTEHDDVIFRDVRLAAMVPNRSYAPIIQDILSTHENIERFVKDYALDPTDVVDRLKDTTLSTQDKISLFHWNNARNIVPLDELITAKDLQEYMKFDTHDIVSAINKKHEVYISGSFYALAGDVNNQQRVIKFLQGL